MARKRCDEEAKDLTEAFIAQMKLQLPELRGIAVVFDWHLGEGMPVGQFTRIHSQPNLDDTLKAELAMMWQLSLMQQRLVQNIGATTEAIKKSTKEIASKDANPEPS